MIWAKRIASHALAGLVFTTIWLWLCFANVEPFRLEELWRMIGVVAILGLVVAIFAELDAEQTG